MATRKSKQLNFRIFDKEFSLEANAEIENFLQLEIQACNHKLAELQANFPNQSHEMNLSMYILWRAGKYAEEQLFIQEQLNNYRDQLKDWQAQIISEPTGENQNIENKNLDY